MSQKVDSYMHVWRGQIEEMIQEKKLQQMVKKFDIWCTEVVLPANKAKGIRDASDVSQSLQIHFVDRAHRNMLCATLTWPKFKIHNFADHVAHLPRALLAVPCCSAAIVLHVAVAKQVVSPP